MKNVYNPLDVVTLREPRGIAIQGAVGTIVEKFHNDAYLVEFCDKKGRMKELLSLSEKEISKLNID